MNGYKAYKKDGDGRMENKNSIQTRTYLSSNQLSHRIDASAFEFETTEHLPELSGIVGQERGTSVMKFGLNVHQDGYNLYVAGIAGTGKTSFTESIVREFAKKETTLYDWCYVHNFEDIYKPKAIQLPVGYGRRFQRDMKQLVESLKQDIPLAFNEENYQKEKTEIVRVFKNERTKMSEQINDIAAEYGFVIRQTASGMMTIPMVDGEPMSEEKYHTLSKEQVKKIDEKSNQLQERIVDATRQLSKLEKETKEEIDQLNQKVALRAISYHMDDLNEKYKSSQAVLAYFDDLQEDIIHHIESFLTDDSEEEMQAIGEMLQGNHRENIFKKYEVNLLIDNRKTKGAPVVIADNPTYYNVVGKVEYENRMGVMSTDFTKVKPGFLHYANGGYLIIQAKDIFSKNFAWEGLKRALLNKKLQIENLGEQTGLMATTSISPEPIPLSVKVILIGNMDIYQLLYQHDEDFNKLFKIRADFDIEMDFSQENMASLANFIHTHCKKHHLNHFDRSAVAKIVEYSMRIAGHQRKLSTRFNQLVEMIYEASTWAGMMDAKLVSAEHVAQAIEERAYRSGLYEEKIQEQMQEGTILIDTEGEKIGQVNGLAVYNLGQYSFGKPSRITATTFVGRKGIINIERESKMGGNIHNKGVYILNGFLGDRFAQKSPLALTAHLAFEQSYGGVDGDSASSTELYAILSSLAKVPIKQGLAVTGSVNQKGEIQPIGGANEKIEGYYKVCESKGLTGEQGVLIPHQNVKNLMLKDEVVEAVEAGRFHIYAVKTIEEGIELLTGVTAGEIDAEGNYEQESVFGKVIRQLKAYADVAEDKKK